MNDHSREQNQQRKKRKSLQNNETIFGVWRYTAWMRLMKLSHCRCSWSHSRMHMCRECICYRLRLYCVNGPPSIGIEWMGTSKMRCDSESKPYDEKQKFAYKLHDGVQYSKCAMLFLMKQMMAYGNRYAHAAHANQTIHFMYFFEFLLFNVWFIWLILFEFFKIHSCLYSFLT